MFKKIVFVCGVFCVLSANAQSSNFEGASISLNTGFNSEQVFLVNVNLSNDTTPININASYTLALFPKVTLAVGVNYDFSNTKILSETVSGVTSDWYIKNHYSINIEPGYILNENSLGYAKLSYHRAKSYWNNSYSFVDQNIKGVGYGFGAKFFMNRNLFLNLEIQKTTYDSFIPSSADITVTHKTTTSIIGVGYKF